MSEKTYSFLLLCGILCLHQILADDSSDNLVRRKRVINLVPGEDVGLQSGDVPYVVNIRKALNHNRLCVGTILTRKTVITVANCVRPFNISSIKLLAGSAYYHRGTEYNVIEKKIHIGNHRRSTGDGVALLTVEPAFMYNSRIGNINLHHGLLLPGMEATIFGWGYNTAADRGTRYHFRLRSITVPIMNHSDCVSRYRGHMVISENDICTYDANKRCGNTDAGAPLVVDDQLAGLHLWRAPLPGCTGPDVFVILQSLEYSSWIRNNIV